VYGLRGQGWQAVAVRVAYVRREVLPSFAAIEWAPGGDWGNAAAGDPNTWNGYAMHVASARPKLTNPAGCTPPPEQAYRLNDEFNQATTADPNADETTVIDTIARQHGTTAEAVEEQIVLVETWTMC
jgi:hypothetical protein